MYANGPDKDYQAHNDADTLMSAEKIKADPKRMKAAQCYIDEMHGASKKVQTDIRKRLEKKTGKRLKKVFDTDKDNDTPSTDYDKDSK